VTHFNSPLRPIPADPLGEPYHSQFNLAAAVQTYLDSGVVAAKLTAGIPFYGHGYGSVAAQPANGLFAAYSGVAPAGTWENGTFDYWDLAANYVNRNGYTRYWQDSARVPWLHNPVTHIMISYDDSASVAEKCRLIRQYQLGGAMFWEFSGDRQHVLLNCLDRQLRSEGTRVTLYRTGENELTLRWTPVAEASAYRVEWSGQVNGFWDVAATVTTTSYSEAIQSSQRYYRVIAILPD
jgi:chitinase